MPGIASRGCLDRGSVMTLLSMVFFLFVLVATIWGGRGLANPG